MIFIWRRRNERQIVLRAVVRKKLEVIIQRRWLILRLCGNCWNSINCFDVVAELRFFYLVVTLLSNNEKMK